MAWYSLDGWDAAGAGAEFVSKGLDSVANSVNALIQAANDSIKQEKITATQL